MKKEKSEPNYRALFVLGISFLSLGISFTAIKDRLGPLSIVFFAVGMVFLGISAKNRDKWTKKQQN